MVINNSHPVAKEKGRWIGGGYNNQCKIYVFATERGVALVVRDSFGKGGRTSNPYVNPDAGLFVVGMTCGNYSKKY